MNFVTLVQHFKTNYQFILLCRMVNYINVFFVQERKNEVSNIVPLSETGEKNGNVMKNNIREYYI